MCCVQVQVGGNSITSDLKLCLELTFLFLYKSLMDIEWLHPTAETTKNKTQEKI